MRRDLYSRGKGYCGTKKGGGGKELSVLFEKEERGAGSDWKKVSRGEFLGKRRKEILSAHELSKRNSFNSRSQRKGTGPLRKETFLLNREEIAFSRYWEEGEFSRKGGGPKRNLLNGINCQAKKGTPLSTKKMKYLLGFLGRVRGGGGLYSGFSILKGRGASLPASWRR